MSPSDPDASRMWVALELCVPAAYAELLIGELGPGSLGAFLAPGEADASRMTLYWSSTAEAEQAAARALATLDRLGVTGTHRDSIRISEVADGRWAERYQASLRPIELGTGFVVQPGSDTPAATSARREIRLVPGGAFGTGEHPTTQLCAAGLERQVVDASRWLDLGCGSGILSVVAVHCGAARVLALDNDPDAVEVASEVLESNGVGDRVEARLGSVENLRDRWDGVVVNIASGFFLEFAAEIRRCLRSDGRLIASGFLVEQVAEVQAALESVGFRTLRSHTRGEWASLEGRSALEPGS